MSNSTKQWFSLYTKPGSEKKVASILSRKNIINYCPHKRHWNGKKIIVTEPLFSSYVFVQIEEDDFQKVRMIDGVLNFVYWLGKPAIIREDEIEIKKNVMNEYDYVKIEKVPFNVDGTGRVLEVTADDSRASKISIVNKEIRISLSSLGYMLIAEVETKDLRTLPLKNESHSIFDRYQYYFKQRLAI